MKNILTISLSLFPTFCSSQTMHAGDIQSNGVQERFVGTINILGDTVCETNLHISQLLLTTENPTLHEFEKCMTQLAYLLCVRSQSSDSKEKFEKLILEAASFDDWRSVATEEHSSDGHFQKAVDCCENLINEVEKNKKVLYPIHDYQYSGVHCLDGL